MSSEKKKTLIFYLLKEKTEFDNTDDPVNFFIINLALCLGQIIFI